MADRNKDYAGVTIPMGHKIESYDGYTLIDVPGQAKLHCEFSVDEGDIVIRFTDHSTAKGLLEQIVAKRFRGFKLEERTRE